MKNSHGLELVNVFEKSPFSSAELETTTGKKTLFELVFHQIKLGLDRILMKPTSLRKAC